MAMRTRNVYVCAFYTRLARGEPPRVAAISVAQRITLLHEPARRVMPAKWPLSMIYVSLTRSDNEKICQGALWLPWSLTKKHANIYPPGSVYIFICGQVLLLLSLFYLEVITVRWLLHYRPKRQRHSDLNSSMLFFLITAAPFLPVLKTRFSKNSRTIAIYLSVFLRVTSGPSSSVGRRRVNLHSPITMTLLSWRQLHELNKSPAMKIQGLNCNRRYKVSRNFGGRQCSAWLKLVMLSFSSWFLWCKENIYGSKLEENLRMKFPGWSYIEHRRTKERQDECGACNISEASAIFNDDRCSGKHRSELTTFYYDVLRKSNSRSSSTRFCSCSRGWNVYRSREIERAWGWQSEKKGW